MPLRQRRESAHFVLWGHDLQDYCDMFGLQPEELAALRLLECYCGPTSLNAELSTRGGQVISVDALYALEENALKQHINEASQSMQTLVRTHQDRFNWDKYDSVDAIIEHRNRGIAQFLKDFPMGKQQRRYVSDELLRLNFDENSFDLALCSHYLFTGRAPDDIDFHTNAIMEMTRVAKEVRIFPLIDSIGDITPLLNPVMLALQHHDTRLEVLEVPYHLQSRGNAMLKVIPLACEL